jgi:dihydrolipoamide dehydrogenase
MTTLDVDVAVIGAGTAGLVALREIRKVTDRFVLIQHGPMGTTCARVGCMPSKVLIQTAEDFHRRAFLDAKGIRGGELLRVDGANVMRHVRALRNRFTDGMIEKTLQYGDKLIRGRARFVNANRLDVEGRIIEANRIIIATGSRPAVPDKWKMFGSRVLTSDTIFELQTLPESLAVIGMGVIGVELGQAMARLGVEVVGVARSGRIAALSDPAVTESAVKAFSREFDL